MSNVQANCINGSNTKPLCLSQKIPSTPVVVLERATRQLDVGGLITGVSAESRAFLQGNEHSLPHLSRGCEREGNGQDLFWLVHFRQQLQQAASQQSPLSEPAGACTRKDSVVSRVRARSPSSTGSEAISVFTFIRLITAGNGIVFGNPAESGQVTKLTCLRVNLVWVRLPLRP